MTESGHFHRNSDMPNVSFRKIHLLLGMSGLALLLCSCVQRDDAPGVSDRNVNLDSLSGKSISSQFASIAETAVSNGIVEGIQFAIVEDGRVLTTQAFGLADREENRPMTVDTPINVASISKSVTAWGVLALAERSNVDLNAPVRSLLSEVDLYDETFPGIEVSIRMLLSHTSGLSGPSVPVTPATDSLPGVSDVLLGRSSVPRPLIERPPGSGFAYSGAGYLVLQELVENQGQQEFAAFMAEAVLGRARMPDSTYVLAPDLLERVAVYYRADGRRREPYHLPGAAGGLYSTANDMARFVMLYTDNGQAIRNQIISDEGFVALLGPVADSVEYGNQDMPIRYALGHYTYETEEGTKIAFHAGGNPGLRAFFIVAMERNIGFFAVANNDRGNEVLAEMLLAWGDNYGLTLHSYH